MGVLTYLKNKFKRSHPSAPQDWLLYGMSGGAQTVTGQYVTEDIARKTSAVYGCSKILAEGVGSLPLITYKELKPRGKERARDHPFYDLLRYSPNPMMTGIEFWETCVGHLCLWGNAYCAKFPQQTARPKELWPLNPSQVEVKLDKETNTYFYLWHMPNGGTRIFPKDEIVHFKAFSGDGLVGLSPIGQVRESIGLLLSAEEFAGRLFRDGLRPSGVLEHPEALSPKALSHLQKSFKDDYGGLSNAQKVMILEEGMKWRQLTIPPADAQFLETRKFQLEDIARIFRVPLHLLQSLDRATFDNIEHQSLEFVTFTLQPWLVRIEQGLRRQLFTAQDKADGFFAEYLAAGLLRGDVKSRYEAYAVARQNGWLSADDIRELENMNPIGEENGGNIYLVPLNMVPSQMAMEMNQEPTSSSEQEEQNQAREMRASSMKNLHRISDRYHRLFIDGINRVVYREINDLRKAIKKELRDIQSFSEWLTHYYNDMPSRVLLHMRPAMISFAESVVDSINLEGEALLTAEARGAIAFFQESYVTDYSKRYVGRSLSALRKLIRSNAKPQDLADAIDKKVTDWEQNRALFEADDEIVRMRNAVRFESYYRAGVSKINWIAHTGSCQFCQQMARTFGPGNGFLQLGEPFLKEGEQIGWKDEETGKYNVIRNTGYPKKHPPIHRGCKCDIQVAK